MKKDYLNLANILTFSRIIFGIVFLLLFIISKNNNFIGIKLLIIEIVSFIIFIIAIITDGLDGYFARKSNTVTSFGKHFDPLADSIFFIIVFFTFVTLNYMIWPFFILIFLREGFMHIFLRPYIKSKGTTLPANIYGKIKTVVQCTFSLIILALLMLKEIFFINSFSNNSLIKTEKIIQVTSHIFFGIIVFLSIFSLIIYLFNFFKAQKKS